MSLADGGDSFILQADVMDEEWFVKQWIGHTVISSWCGPSGVLMYDAVELSDGMTR